MLCPKQMLDQEQKLWRIWIKTIIADIANSIYCPWLQPGDIKREGHKGL